MLGQLQINGDGKIRDKVQMSVDLIRKWEPEEGYYVAFSGGKDSQCVYHLCQIAGVKFDAHYSVTSVDPPELVRFIREHYPDVQFERQYRPDGKPYTMWNLIPEKLMPPTRVVRYCCEKLKESNGMYRYTVTGVRWAESANRKNNQGFVTVTDKSKKLKRELEDNSVNFTKTNQGGVVLNFDNDNGKDIINRCIRTKKMLINPIIHWDEEDVWEFLNSNAIPHCCLYDEGYKRLGCIGCPMAQPSGMEKDFERWPKYRELYIKAFERMISVRRAKGLQEDKANWETGEDVMRWWLSK